MGSTGWEGAHLACSLSKNCKMEVYLNIEPKCVALGVKLPPRRKITEEKVSVFMSAEHHLAVVQFPSVICLKYLNMK